MGDDQRGAAVRGDHVGHGEGLARPGDAEQDLALVPPLDPLGQLGDRAGLVAARRIGRVELERRGGLVPRQEGPRASRHGALGAAAQPALGHDRVRSLYVRTNGFSGTQRATNSKVVASFFFAGALDSTISQSP